MNETIVVSLLGAVEAIVVLIERLAGDMAKPPAPLDATALPDLVALDRARVAAVMRITSARVRSAAERIAPAPGGP